MEPFETLTADHADRIAQMWNRSQPSEPLTAREIGRVLTHDPGVVYANEVGVVAACAHDDRGHIRLLAVLPEARRAGHGRSLLRAAEAWLTAHGARELRWGAEIPYYLWPGIDRSWNPAIGLASSAGYTGRGTAINMDIPTTLHCTPTLPIRRVTSRDDSIGAVRRLVLDNWAPWIVEVDLAAEQGTLFVAFDAHSPVSFMAHSTLRDGWLGPMGTDPAYRGRGVGAGVVQATCADLAARGFAIAHVAWVGPEEYFARLGAVRARTFIAMVKTQTADGPARPGN